MFFYSDSLVYCVETEDFYKDILNNPNLLNRMDTSNLDREHPCYIAERKKIPGHFSDETDGKIMSEFIALRAKFYAYNIEGKERIKAKGIRSHAVKNHMTLENHKKYLLGDQEYNKYTDNISIKSFKHHIMTIETKKINI